MTTLAEPEWDEQTRDIALANAAVDLCPRCGGPAHLCQDPALQDSWAVPEPVRCHRTTALRAKQKGYTEESNPVVEALIFRTILRGARRG